MSLTKKMSGFTTSSQTAPNISALGSAASSKKKVKKKSTQRSVKISKKFLKLNEDLYSKSTFLPVSQLNNLNSMSNININCNVNNSKKLKCLMVGDAKVGKSALMFLFLKRIFQHEYRPTIVDDYEGTL